MFPWLTSLCEKVLICINFKIYCNKKRENYNSQRKRVISFLPFTNTLVNIIMRKFRLLLSKLSVFSLNFDQH